jgi:hypothetical protein
MSQALRTLSGMFVGPGMKTGFWNDIGALSLEYVVTLTVRPPQHNFFENIFHLPEGVPFFIPNNGLRFFSG